MQQFHPFSTSLSYCVKNIDRAFSLIDLARVEIEEINKKQGYISKREDEIAGHREQLVEINNRFDELKLTDEQYDIVQEPRFGSYQDDG